MKKIILFFFLPFLFFVLVSTSCSSGSDEVMGVIKSMVDSTQMMTADINGEDGLFFYGDAAFPNGAVMPGDSVVISYRGALSKAVASSIKLIPRKGTIVDLDALRKSDEPQLTKPATEESLKNMKDFKEKSSRAKVVTSD